MRKFIIGTDWWTDCDDAVALALAAKSAAAGETELLGIGINACMEYSVASLTNFLRCFGVSGIPIGIDRDATDFGGHPPYQRRLALMTDNVPCNGSAPDAAEMYVDILSSLEGTAEIIEIGYPQVLARAMKLAPELFRKKVDKIWMMAGKWNDSPGRENNFARNVRSACGGHYVCLNSPVPITFLGFEVGETVIAGGHADRNGVLYRVLEDHGSPHGRFAWDPMLVLTALIGDEKKAGYTTVRGTASVDEKTGENTFEENPNGKHVYLVKDRPDEYYKNAIDCLLK